MQLYTYQATLNNIPREILSILSPDRVENEGISSSSVVGYKLSAGGPVSAENVVINPHFLRLLHQVVQMVVPNDPDCLEMVSIEKEGKIHVTDKRNGDDVSEDDIVGTFEFTEGKIPNNGYQPNSNYKLINEAGVFVLDSGIEERLLQEVVE